jgi:DNA-binding HxlR family transcriptional regulator
VPYRPFAGQNCSIARALELVGERWSLLVMREVMLGRRRFGEIREQLGVAPNILSDRLGTLVEHGLLRHDGHGEYRLTAKGADLHPVLIALMRWGDRHAAPDGPPRVAVHVACGHDAEPEYRCGHCGDVLEPGALKVRPGPGASERQRAEPLLPS